MGNCEVKKLHCDELELMVDGVGNMNVNVNCNTVKAKVDGVGNIKLSGKADRASLKRDGVGRINHKGLKCPECEHERLGILISMKMNEKIMRLQ